MTSYLTQCVCGPVISPYFADDKGGVVNRTKCAGEQLKNNALCVTGAVLTGAATVGAAKVVSKTSNSAVLTKLISKFSGIVDKVAKKIAPEKVAEKVAKLSGKTKAIGLIALAGATVLSYLGYKHTYKMGQIDQKYTDRAKIAF